MILSRIVVSVVLVLSLGLSPFILYSFCNSGCNPVAMTYTYEAIASQQTVGRLAGMRGRARRRKRGPGSERAQRQKVEEEEVVEEEEEEEDIYSHVNKTSLLQGINALSSQELPNVINFVNPALDSVYDASRGLSPVVIEHYKLLFFLPQDDDTAREVWVQLFQKMMLSSTSNSTLRYLCDYSLEEANQFIASPEWTRAVFIQDPKERFLSAYLNLAKANEGEYLRDVVKTQHSVCCFYGDTVTQCSQRLATNPHKLFGALDRGCSNPHWNLQSERMDSKYWDQINFWGHSQSIQQDAKRLLERIGAWERFGQELKFERNDDNMQELVEKWYRYNLEVKVLDFYDKDYRRFGLSKELMNAPPQDEARRNGMGLSPEMETEPQMQ